MKKTFLILLMAAGILTSLNAKPTVKQVDPLSWWTEMECPLTLMVHGTDLQDATVSIQAIRNGKLTNAENGLVVRGQHNAESANYLFIDLDVNEAGTYRFTLTKNRKKTTFDYVIEKRRPNSRERIGFNSSDLIYLVMSDRFVDGDESNNTTKTTLEPTNKDNVHGRFGGDIQGVINQLPRLEELGVTAVWPTPMLLDNEPAWSYHGYACADYYHIDPRMGSNELYRQMVAEAHKHGIKFIMDMVPNHCGAAHWWMADLPYQDWINQYPTFTRTNGAFSTNYDPNASEYDKALNQGGWFDNPMPDMNLNNPDLLHYFKQWAIWWIEYADLDGLRVDTYPYISRNPGADWCKAIMTEYPNLNIVGECWTRPTSAVAYWQAGAGNKDGFDSHMPSVMDFPLEEAIRRTLQTNGKSWGGSFHAVYDVLSQDYLYGDVNNILLFLTNHDMARIADEVSDVRRVKLGMTMLATMRGIPQLFYGEEYNLHSTNTKNPGSHSELRMPLPLDGLTDEMEDMNRYVSTLFNWRKTMPVIHTGKTMHFHSSDNTYAFFRYNEEEAVFVFINGANEARTIPVEHYAEILKRYTPEGTDILSGVAYDLTNTDITIEPLTSIIVPIHK